MKDYDSTLARIAGNVASGLVSKAWTVERLNLHDPATQKIVADISIGIAEQIVEGLKVQHEESRTTS